MLLRPNYTDELGHDARRMHRTTKVPPAVVVVAPASNGRFDPQPLLANAYAD
jgi:hypothetical protein